VHLDTEQLGALTQIRCEFDIEATMRFTIENRSAGHGASEHLFKAECLCAKLHEITVGGLTPAALVFDREGFGTELDYVRAAHQAETLAR
jgi:hypothetical protein